MGNALALDYRPVRLAEVVGQGHVTPILKAMVSSGRVPPVLLFNGTRGTGKTTCARIFAAALNCIDPKGGDACGSCERCVAVQHGRSTSVLEIDAASNGGVNEVRNLKELCRFAHSGEWRVIILDEAHSMSNEAYNALLKLLEEPMERTAFILVTTEPEKILRTVHSRSMPFEFRRLRMVDLVQRMKVIAEGESLGAEDSLLYEIAKSAEGGMRDAVMLLDQVSLVGIKSVDDYREFFGLGNYALPLLWAALRGDHAEGHRLITDYFSRTGDAAGMVADLTHLVSDLLVLKSGGKPSVQESEIEERVELMQAVPTERLVKVIEVLWELKRRTRATENDQFSSMEMGFVLITEAVKDPTVQQSVEAPKTILPVQAPAPQRLSLAEIAQAAEG